MKKKGRNILDAKVSRRDVLKGGLVGAAAASTVHLWPTILRAQEKVLHIGVCSPASGNFADMGMGEQRGVDLAVRDFNAKGGVLGNKVEVLIEDTQSNPMIGARKARALIQRDKVKFLVGGISSAEVLAVSSVAAIEKVVYVGTNGNAAEITGEKCNRYTFRVCAEIPSMARMCAEYLIKNVGKKWFLFTHDYAAGHSAREAYKAISAKEGGTILGDELIPMGTTDFSPFLLKVRQAKPDVLVGNVWGTDGINLLKQGFEFGITKEFPFASTPMDFLDHWAVGPDVSRGYGVVEWYHLGHPGAQAFIDKYKKAYPGSVVLVPENNCYDGYIGTKALLLAIEKAGTITDVPKVIEAFENLKFNEPINDSDVWIRNWDHQFIQNFYLVKSKLPKEMTDRTDYFEILKIALTADYSVTKAESKCKMGPF
jgi:branched-chain amino acid transport system substrate-binding protein